MDKKEKDYLTNVMQALGACDINAQQTYGPAALAHILDSGDPKDLRTAIYNGVVRGIQDDLKTRNIFRQEFAFDFTAVKSILMENKIGLSEKDCDQVLRLVSVVNANNTVDILLSGVENGLTEQPNLDEKTSNQVLPVLDTMIEDGYQDFIKNSQANGVNVTEANYPLAKYKEDRTKADIIAELRTLFGSNQKVQQILSHPINPDGAILANNVLNQTYQDARQQRKNQNQPLTVMDLLMAAGKAATRAQVMAFCEARVVEQDQVQPDGSKVPLDADHRLGNVLGKDGRKEVEDTIDGRLPNKLVPTNQKAKKAPAKPAEKLRGRGKLAKIVKADLDRIYGAIQTVGHLNRMFPDKKVVMGEISQKHQWDVAYEKMPDEYRDQAGNLNAAGVFYNDMQTLMIADRVNITKLTTEINADQLNRKPELRLRLRYYQERLNLEQASLHKVAQKIKFDQGVIPDQAYFAQLKDDVINLLGDSVAQMSQAEQDQHINFLNEPVIQTEISNANHRSSESEMALALHTFANFESSKDADEKNASYTMLADLFSIRDKYEDGQITSADLDNLMHNIKNGPFNPAVVSQLIHGLTTYDANKNTLLSSEACRTQLHTASEKFLKEHKYAQSYTKYQLNEEAVNQMQNM